MLITINVINTNKLNQWNRENHSLIQESRFHATVDSNSSVGEYHMLYPIKLEWYLIRAHRSDEYTSPYPRIANHSVGHDSWSLVATQPAH